jgi:DNA-binding response OmpR family regulator
MTAQTLTDTGLNAVSSNSKKSRILIAEPDLDIRNTLRLYLEEQGLEIQTVERAGSIIKVARPWQPNVILISTDFTDQDAHQVCIALMEDTLTGHIPTLLLLHVNERQARLAALEAGASDVIAKPFDLEELHLRIEAAIRLATKRVEV